MSTPVVLPAPLWRRLLAALYDGLLLLAIWMAADLLAVIGGDLLGAKPGPAFIRAYLLALSCLFFGWFWCHGGQTLGARAWRLQVRRLDGTALHWPDAMLRFALGALAWLPLGLGLVMCLFDHRRRALHDYFSGTEVVLLPKAGPARG